MDGRTPSDPSRPDGPWPGLEATPASPPLYEPPRIGADPVGFAAPATAGREEHAEAPSGLRAGIIGAVVGAVVAVLVSGGLVLALDDGRTDQAAPASNFAPSAGGAGLDIPALLAQAQPSVVSIETDAESLRGIFGGAGSGVIISEDGLVLTNAHVIANADTITVILPDGTSREADLVGSFPDEDVAIVQVQGVDGMTPATLGRSADLQVGEDVVAVGNALGLGGTPSVTRGIVSALDRSIEAPGVSLDDLIQTDTAINPGNSGGPLLDSTGQVVGINTAIIEGAQNVGFALSIDAVAPLIEELLAGNGTITPDSAFLGVSTQSLAGVPIDELEAYGVTSDDGAFVLSIVEGSAAEQGGLQEGDVILEIDGEAVSDPSRIADIVLGSEPGDELEIVYERAGTEQRTTVTLTTRDEVGD